MLVFSQSMFALYLQVVQCKFTYCSQYLWPWKAGRNHNSTKTRSAGTPISLPCSHTSQIASLAPEHAPFALWELAQAVSEGSSSEPTALQE